jgi:hypothetical protein
MQLAHSGNKAENFCHLMVTPLPKMIALEVSILLCGQAYG